MENMKLIAIAAWFVAIGVFILLTSAKMYYKIQKCGSGKYIVYKKQGMGAGVNMYYMTPHAIQVYKTHHPSYCDTLPWGYLADDSVMFNSLEEAKAFVKKVKREDRKRK